jgi:hypothetical protein
LNLVALLAALLALWLHYRGAGLCQTPGRLRHVAGKR